MISTQRYAIQRDTRAVLKIFPYVLALSKGTIKTDLIREKLKTIAIVTKTNEIVRCCLIY